jgi:predicted transcriptional regulator
VTHVEKLGKLQLAIMRVLWGHDEATAADVHTVLLPTHGLAPTTIATMLRKMEDKGVVAHRTQGRRFVYRATVSEARVTKSMVAELTQWLFDGDPVALASHLIEEHAVEPTELDELRQVITKAKRKERRK